MLLIMSTPQQNQKLNQLMVMQYHQPRCQHPTIKFWERCKLLFSKYRKYVIIFYMNELHLTFSHKYVFKRKNSIKSSYSY